jgi:hypothetical protein
MANPGQPPGEPRRVRRRRCVASRNCIHNLPPAGNVPRAQQINKGFCFFFQKELLFLVLF